MTFVILVDRLFTIYWWILIARFLTSWLPNLDYRQPIIQFLYKVTDPVIRPFQGILRYGSIDFSPMLVFLLLRLIRPLVISLLLQLFS